MPDQTQPGTAQAPQPAAQPEAQPVPQPRGFAKGRRPDLRRHVPALAVTAYISDDMARIMLADCASFLGQIIALTAGVVESINVGQLRSIVGPELAKAIGVIDEDGTVLTQTREADSQPDDAQEQPRRDHRKEPRGRKHPLTALIQCALQACKLLERITRSTNPHVFNAEHYQSRIERAEQARADKVEAASDRSFAQMLKR